MAVVWRSFGGEGLCCSSLEVGGFCGKIGDNLCLAATASVHLLVLDRGNCRGESFMEKDLVSTVVRHFRFLIGVM